MKLASNEFLAIEGKRASYEDARFVILPIPYDATTSYRAGTRNGPGAILEASRQVEDFDEELGTALSGCRMATLEPLEVRADGPAAMHDAIFRSAKRVIRDGKFLFSLGGEHSITSGLVRAVMTRHRKLSILQIDAHADLRDQYEGSPYSHASVMRRVLELGARIVPVGIRNISHEENAFARREKLRIFSARECVKNDHWMEDVVNALADPVYITVDIDGFDPAFAPGTGTPEPGGLDWYKVTALLRKVIEQRNVVAADVVEVMPIPGQSVTEFLAARLAYKIIAYVHHCSARR